MNGAPFVASDDNIQVKTEQADGIAEINPSPNRKRQRSFGNEPFTKGEEASIRQKLDVALSRNETTQRPGPGGCRLTYIEGWRVIHDANQIFGFNGWSSQIVQIDVRYIEETGSRFSACVCATVRVTLRDGCSREDRGGGVADNMRSKGEAILKAEKEAVTDATKRTLKNFGLRLGLSLYDREHIRELNRPQPVQKSVQRAPMNTMHTPVVNRSIPFHGNASAAKKRMASPVTPAANVTEHNAQDAQIEMQRQQAIARRQACLRAQGGVQSNLNNSTNVGGAVVAVKNEARRPDSGSSSAGYKSAQYAPVATSAAGTAVRGVSGNAAIAQNEIDELSAMAFAEF